MRVSSWTTQWAAPLWRCHCTQTLQEPSSVLLRTPQQCQATPGDAQPVPVVTSQPTACPATTSCNDVVSAASLRCLDTHGSGSQALSPRLSSTAAAPPCDMRWLRLSSFHRHPHDCGALCDPESGAEAVGSPVDFGPHAGALSRHAVVARGPCSQQPPACPHIRLVQLLATQDLRAQPAVAAAAAEQRVVRRTARGRSLSPITGADPLVPACSPPELPRCADPAAAAPTACLLVS